MPAGKHTRVVRGRPKLSRMWEHIRASAEARGDPPGVAIRKASGVVKRQSRRGARRR